MNFKQILIEAFEPEKHFNSEEELITSVKSILRKSSITRYKEIKSKDKGFSLPQKYGYSYKFYNGNITISLIGVEKTSINELMRTLTHEKIVYHYNSSNEIFLIKGNENIIPSEEVFPTDVSEELKNNSYNIIGQESKDKNGIKDIINNFDSIQKRIYLYLISNELIEWKYIRNETGNKFVYKLVKIEGEN